jgi:tetratricopeptide (TPR) repeat protein
VKTALFLLPALLLAGAGDSHDFESRILQAADLHKKRDYSGAAAVYESLLIELASSDGISDLAARAHNGLASIHQDLGQFEESEKAYLRALAHYKECETASFGVHVLANLGSLYMETQQLGRLRETARSAAVILKSIPPDGRESARLEHLIGLAEKMDGRMESAKFHLSRALAILRTQPEGNEVALADITNSLGTMAFSAGQYRDAVDLFLEAMMQYDKGQDVASTNRAATLTNIACSYLHLRMRDHANGTYSEALKALDEDVGLSHPYALQVMQAYATALEDTGDKRGARQQRRRAEAILQSMQPSNPGRHVVDVVELQGGQ